MAKKDNQTGYTRNGLTAVTTLYLVPEDAHKVKEWAKRHHTSATGALKTAIEKGLGICLKK